MAEVIANELGSSNGEVSEENGNVVPFVVFLLPIRIVRLFRRNRKLCEHR